MCGSSLMPIIIVGYYCMGILPIVLGGYCMVIAYYCNRLLPGFCRIIFAAAFSRVIDYIYNTVYSY